MTIIYGPKKILKQTFEFQRHTQQPIEKTLYLEPDYLPKKIIQIRTSDVQPRECPFCFDNSKKEYIYHNKYENKVQIWFLCNKCKESFIAYYENNNIADNDFYFTGKTTKGNFKLKNIPSEIKKYSPDFENLYNQALKANQENLYDICGPAFRKAFEFLLKDFLINFKLFAKSKIRNTKLFDCINMLDLREEIKDLYHQIRVYGNQETHYTKLKPNLEEKNIKDFIELIDMVILDLGFKIKYKNKKIRKNLIN